MEDEVGDRRTKEAQPGLHDHESHLADRRATELSLDIGLDRFQELPAERACRADGDDRQHDRLLDRDNRREPCEQHAASVDKAGVHQRGGRRRRGHRREDPGVERDECRLNHRCNDEPARGNDGGCRRHPTDHVKNPGDRGRACRRPQEDEAESNQRCASDKVPTRGAPGSLCLGPPLDMADQRGHEQPHRQPRPDEQRDVVGGDDDHYRQCESKDAGEKGVFVGIAGKIPARVAVDDPAKEGNDHPHHHSEAINHDKPVNAPCGVVPNEAGHDGERSEPHCPHKSGESGRQRRRVVLHIGERSDRSALIRVCHVLATPAIDNSAPGGIRHWSRSLCYRTNCALKSSILPVCFP